MKRILSFSLVFMLLITSMVSVVYAKDGGIPVKVNQKNVVFSDSAPFIDVNNRTLVPLRAIGEAMGLDVMWDNVAKAATFTKVYSMKNTPAANEESYVGKESLTFTIDSKDARIRTYYYPNDYVVKGADDMNFTSDGWGTISMDTAAIIRGARTYAPVKYLAESFRFDVEWNNADKTVEIYGTKVLGEVDITLKNVGFWEDHQAWIFMADEKSKIKSVEVLKVLSGDVPVTIRGLTEDEKFTVNEMAPELIIDKTYKAGLVTDYKFEFEHTYKFTFKLLLTMNDGSKERVAFNNYCYFDGAGGYI